MSDAEEIKAKIDIVDYIDKTNPLTKIGDEWKGHTEAGSSSKTSLSVNRDKQVYDNYATGDDGDLYNWIAYKENLDVKNNSDFRKILKIAADSIGYELKNTCKENEKKQVYATMRAAMGFYHSCLTDDIRKLILDTWGIKNETIDKLLIGYAPHDGSALQMGLKELIPQEDLVNAGLIYNNKYDIYISRIIFPYWENGNIVYSIGRSTDLTPADSKGNVRKYFKQLVHKEKSPEVSKYITNNVIFGIDSIKDDEEVIICEGVTDAIILHQAGIPAISPITTSFKGSTLSHVLEILKPIKSIFICNDNEKPKGKETKGAGDKGADKTIKALTENGLEVRKIQLPKDDDVDKIDLADYMKDHKVEDFRLLMDNAVVHNAANVTRSYRMTDTGNAQRMNDLFGEDLLYCNKSKKWLTWDTCRWREDDTGNIYKLAKKSVEAIHDYADSLPDGDTEKDDVAEIKKKSDIKKKWQKHASSSGSTAKLKAMVENLQSEDNIPVLMEDMDLNGWILPVQNGTIDLKTGNFRESRREDLCTKLANVFYDPTASCREWMKFLGEILPDKDTQRYMQQLTGYGLTGSTSEEQVYVLYGTGSNGKSTFTDTISLSSGDFGINVKASALLTSDNKQSTPDNEIARLKGKRMVTASEPKKGIRLGEDVIKAITNAKSKITARYLYQEPFDFFPTHKTLLSTNHKPSVTDHSRGMRRRLRLIPFTTTIEEDKRDRGLSDKLEKELSGILNWAIEGCLSWQKAGSLIMSDEIERETAGYMADNDKVTEFLDTITTEGSDKDMIPHEWLRVSYNTWAEGKGFKTMNDRTFSDAMTERDFDKGMINGRTQRKGLKLIITKIEDIHKKYPLDKYEKLMNQLLNEVKELKEVEVNEDKRILIDINSLSSEEVEVISNILKNNEKNNNNGNGSCNIENNYFYFSNKPLLGLPNKIYLNKEQKNQIIEYVVRDHGKTPTNDNVMYIADLVHKRNGKYSPYEAAADIKKKYNLDVKPLKADNLDEVLHKIKGHFVQRTGEELTYDNVGECASKGILVDGNYTVSEIEKGLIEKYLEVPA